MSAWALEADMIAGWPFAGGMRSSALLTGARILVWRIFLFRRRRNRCALVRIDLRPGRRDRTGSIPPARGPRERHQPHRDVLARGLEREGLERLGQRVGARAEGVGLGLELGVERGDRLVHRGHRLLGPAHVLGLLEHAPGAAGGGGGPPDGGDGDGLAAEEGAQDGGADRDRGLDALLLGLLALALHRLLGAPAALLEGGLLGRVLLAEGLAPAVAVLAGRLLEADPEVTLRLTRLRDDLERCAPQQLDLLRLEQPGREVTAPPVVALLLARGDGQLGEGAW